MRKKFIFVTGGVLSSLGKGLSAAAHRRAARRPAVCGVTNVKMDPYINVDPGTMSPLPARRGVRHRRRRRDRSGSGALRAVHLRHGPELRCNNFTTGRIYQERHPARAERRVSRLVRCRSSRTSPTRSSGSCTRRRSLTSPRSGSSRSAARSETSRASRSWRPFDSSGIDCRAGERPLRPPHPHPLHLHRRRAQDQAHPALRQGCSVADRHPARSSCSAVIDRELPKRELREKIALFCNLSGSVMSSPVHRMCDNIYRAAAADVLRSRTSTIGSCEKLGIWAGGANGSTEVARPDGPMRLNARHDPRDASESSESTSTSRTPTSPSTRRWRHGGVANNTKASTCKLHRLARLSDPSNPAARARRTCDAILVPGGFGKRGSRGQDRRRSGGLARADVPFFGICLGHAAGGGGVLRATCSGMSRCPESREFDSKLCRAHRRSS